MATSIGPQVQSTESARTSTPDRAFIRSILATLGAIVGLLAVMYEVRQSNRIAEATLDFEVVNNLSQINELLLSNPRVADIVNRANIGGEVSADETYALYTFNVRLLNAWTGMETAYRNGVLPRSTYQLAYDDIELAVKNTGPARRRLWKQIFDSYPSIQSTEIAKAAHAALAHARGDAER